MNTLVCTQPGKFDYRESAEPAVGKGESLIKIGRIGICGTDIHAFEGTQPYFEYPRILGHELAGELVCTDNPAFEIGENVTISPYFHCGKCKACRIGKTNCCVSLKVCGVHTDGGMVEYLKVPSYSLVKSQGLSLDQLALVEPLSIGAHALRRAQVSERDTILVIGAGPIGLGIIQLGPILGAQVIVMDVNQNRLQFCRDVLRVKNVINAADQDAMHRLSELTNGDFPDVVLDATGNLKAINAGFNYVAHGGRYVLVGLQKGDISFSQPAFHKRETTLMSSRNATPEDFNFVIKSIRGNLLDVSSMITHRVSFADLAGEFPRFVRPENGVIKALVEM